MSKGDYLSVYLGKGGISIAEAFDRMAKRRRMTRNELIKQMLVRCIWIAGELE